jgi:hypothetical protein
VSLATNAAQLPTIRLSATIADAAANTVVRPDGSLAVLPGQGGVAVGDWFAGPAGGWVSDHLEPHASLGCADPAAQAALQALACVGNSVTVRSGPAVGAFGVVYGKHGHVLAAFAPSVADRLQPGDTVTVDAVGTALAIESAPSVTVLSCSPGLLETLVSLTGDGRVRVGVALTLPAVAAEAGLGMPGHSFNIDLEAKYGPWAPALNALRFGAVVALEGADHRFGRSVRAGGLAIGCLVHGTSAGGGHGIGMVTLLNGPTEAFDLVDDPGAAIQDLIPWPKEVSP